MGIELFSIGNIIFTSSLVLFLKLLCLLEVSLCKYKLKLVSKTFWNLYSDFLLYTISYLVPNHNPCGYLSSHFVKLSLMLSYFNSFD